MISGEPREKCDLLQTHRLQGLSLGEGPHLASFLSVNMQEFTRKETEVRSRESALFHRGSTEDGG